MINNLYTTLIITLLILLQSCASFPDIYIGVVDIKGAFSPDGTKLALISQRDKPEELALYAANVDGGDPICLSRDISWYVPPIFTPDNKNILYSSKDNRKVLSVDIDTGECKGVFTLSGNTHSRYISADTNLIVFQQISLRDKPALIILKRKENIVKEFNDEDFPYETSFIEISPDSSMIAFGHEKNIYTMEIDSGDIQCLTTKYSKQLEKSWYKSEFFLPFCFSPDNKQIAFATGDSIYLIDVTGNNLRRLIHYDKEYNMRIRDLSFTPDNKHLAFVSEGFVESNDGWQWQKPYAHGLYLYNFEKENQTRIYDATIYYVFSPDSNSILFVEGNMGYNRGMYIMDIDGSNKRRISPDWKH